MFVTVAERVVLLLHPASLLDLDESGPWAGTTR